MSQQPQQQVLYQLQVTVPYIGSQHAAWLYTDPARAAAIQMALQSCPGAPLKLLTKEGQPVLPQQQAQPPYAVPGWPPQQQPGQPGQPTTPGWPPTNMPGWPQPAAGGYWPGWPYWQTAA